MAAPSLISDLLLEAFLTNSKYFPAQARIYSCSPELHCFIILEKARTGERSQGGENLMQAPRSVQGPTQGQRWDHELS